jgi:hypothetical protein
LFVQCRETGQDIDHIYIEDSICADLQVPKPAAAAGLSLKGVISEYCGVACFAAPPRLKDFVVTYVLFLVLYLRNIRVYRLGRSFPYKHFLCDSEVRSSSAYVLGAPLAVASYHTNQGIWLDSLSICRVRRREKSGSNSTSSFISQEAYGT